jgi:alkylation response protein AidB-like acyl-CoA dehydrogenase
MLDVDDVRGLAGEIADRSLETETNRVVADDLVRKLGAAGAFHLFVPASLGGTEADPMTACTIIEELSRADGSTGWTTMILNTTFFASWLDPSVAAELLATDRELGMAGIFAPVGRAVPRPDGALALSGRFPFNSGSHHATWFCQGAMVGADGAAPQWRFLFVPATDVEILDTWRVAGLCGTASHDVVVDDAVVPLERTANPVFETARHDAPHFRWSFFALLAAFMSGFPLGVGRRALDEFIALATATGRGGGEPLATEQVTQLEIARCEGLLRSARCWMLDALATAWDTATAGDTITMPQRIDIRLAASNAMSAAVTVADATLRLAGGKALYDHNPLQRCWRDVHAGRAHIFNSDRTAAIAGRALLDQPLVDGFMV